MRSRYVGRLLCSFPPLPLVIVIHTAYAYCLADLLKSSPANENMGGEMRAWELRGIFQGISDIGVNTENSLLGNVGCLHTYTKPSHR